jgi:hypothetical protein
MKHSFLRYLLLMKLKQLQVLRAEIKAIREAIKDK